MENQNTSKKNAKTVAIIFAVISIVICSILGYNYGKKQALKDNERERIESQNK